MAISRCDMGLKVAPEVVAAITAVLSEMLETEKEKKEVRPYVLRRNRGWKEIALQEGSFVVHFLRR